MALVDLSDGCPTFTGCDSFRRPLQGHKHAYIFCESDINSGGESGQITHVTVYARSGFGLREQQALRSLGRIWGPEELEVRLALQEMGRADDFAGSSPLFGRSRIWVSRTPFLPGRHGKRTRAGVPKCDARGLQIGGPEHELLRLLALAGLPEPVAVETVGGTRLGEREVAWKDFLHQRTGGGQAAIAGYGFRIWFSEAVAGPVALGAESHFGMGGFEADGDGRFDQ